MTLLRRESLTEPRQHHEVGVKPRLLQSARAEHEAIVVLQRSEQALNGRATAVQDSPFLSVALDRCAGISAALPKRNDRRTFAVDALVIDSVVVVALVHRAGVGEEAASAHRVEQ